ncbi:MAG: inositol monophosphatase family protein [Kangiellaceae bacterium]|nr:inositol monophosphatase family protein [Kangiellaceae bacterium]
MNLVEQVSQLAKLVGVEILLPYFKRETARNQHDYSVEQFVTTKNDGSWLTEADIESHDRLSQDLPKIMNYPVLSEEMSEQQQLEILTLKPVNYWCIDPLDGTSNFAQGIPYWCTSIALIENGKQTLAVVYDPNRNECFATSNSTQTMLNGLQLRKTGSVNHTDLSQAMGLIDFKRLNLKMLNRLIRTPPYRSQRSFGASALDLCWIAANRCQVYLHGKQKIWDYAAGLLILINADGKAETFGGLDVFSNQLESKSVIAASNSELMKQWNEYFKLV